MRWLAGNVPSDDRTAEVRKHGFLHSRNLGSEQMTTNTAVLVAKIILQGENRRSRLFYTVASGESIRILHAGTP